MSKQSEQNQLQQQLKSIIKKMRRIQKNIAADEQPAAMHELDALTAYGREYADIIKALEAHKR